VSIRKVTINKPFLGIEERIAVDKVIESGMLTNSTAVGGEKVMEFESKLQEYNGVRYAVAVSSGTAALYCSLLALRLEKRSVQLPSFTFVASANAVRMAGGTPLFEDISLKDYLIDYSLIPRKSDITMPVDLYGHLRDWSSIDDAIVVEDACQAMGSKINGRMAGTLGTIGCLSFYPAKVMTTGEGGCILTNSEDIAATVRMIRNHGQTYGYDSQVLGGNFRMQEMNAAIGIEQLRKLPAMIEKRRRNFKLMMEMFSNLPDVALPNLESHCEPNGYLFTIASKKRDQIKMHLNEVGIGATVYYPTPVNEFQFYHSKDYLPNTQIAKYRVLSLPCHPDVTPADIELMKTAIESEVKT
jgi:perosamine synthetase